MTLQPSAQAHFSALSSNKHLISPLKLNNFLIIAFIINQFINIVQLLIAESMRYSSIHPLLTSAGILLSASRPPLLQPRTTLRPHNPPQNSQHNTLLFHPLLPLIHVYYRVNGGVSILTYLQLSSPLAYYMSHDIFRGDNSAGNEISRD